jgi:hypothetical protein
MEKANISPNEKNADRMPSIETESSLSAALFSMGYSALKQSSKALKAAVFPSSERMQ